MDAAAAGSISTLLHLGRRRYDVAARTHIMGILNVTPDSFSDGGRLMMKVVPGMNFLLNLSGR